MTRTSLLEHLHGWRFSLLRLEKTRERELGACGRMRVLRRPQRNLSAYVCPPGSWRDDLGLGREVKIEDINHMETI